MRTARVIATTVAGLLLSATLTPAHADDTPPTEPAPRCTFSNAKVSKPAVVVKFLEKVTVKVTATATGCEAYDYASLEFGSGSVSGEFSPSDSNPAKWSGTIELETKYLSNSDAGKSWGLVYFDDDSTQHLGASLTVKREAYIDFSGSYLKVKKNKKFKMSGPLDRANWDTIEYWGYSSQPVRLQFRTTHGHYKTIAKMRTGHGHESGMLYKTVKMKKSGCFRVVFDGSSTTGATTSPRWCVKVKK